MKKTNSRSPQLAGKSLPVVRGRNPVNNELLNNLPRNESTAVFGDLEFIEVPTHTILNEMGAPIEHCYFINSGLASVLNVLSDGKSVEVGLSGKEGFVGLPRIVGLKTSPSRVVMQVAGSAFRISALKMDRVLRKSPQLERSLNRYSQELGLQSMQVAACNRMHEVEQRLARWLLMSQDRLGGNVVALTQQFFAHMLGTRRASVTVAAGVLQRAGIINYVRGTVEVVNRRKLESASCDCYEIMTRQLLKWQKEMHRTASSRVHRKT